MSDEPQAVVVDTELHAPPERVWQAISDPSLSSRWLPQGAVGVSPGECFSLDDEGRRIDCEVIDAEPGRRLRLSWREADGAVASEVTFTLSPTPEGGTRLRVVHGPVLASLTGRRPSASMRSFPMRMAA
jgi:uncharacterized protein YndB with AHSA1/START domain